MANPHDTIEELVVALEGILPLAKFHLASAPAQTEEADREQEAAIAAAEKALVEAKKADKPGKPEPEPEP